MKIRVITYSGYKADEYPQSFFLGERELLITEIVDRYYDPREDIFKVRAGDGLIYILARNRENQEWRLRSGGREFN